MGSNSRNVTEDCLKESKNKPRRQLLSKDIHWDPHSLNLSSQPSFPNPSTISASPQESEDMVEKPKQDIFLEDKGEGETLEFISIAFNRLVTFPVFDSNVLE